MKYSVAYYKQMEEGLNILVFDQEIYVDSSEGLPDWVKDSQYQYRNLKVFI